MEATEKITLKKINYHDECNEAGSHEIYCQKLSKYRRFLNAHNIIRISLLVYILALLLFSTFTFL